MDSGDIYWAFIDFANGILSGAMLGGYYALISVGLALNFGVMRLVNLSHGDWLIVAAYLCVGMLTAFPVSPFWTLPFVVPVMYGAGVPPAARPAQPRVRAGRGTARHVDGLRDHAAAPRHLRPLDRSQPGHAASLQRRRRDDPQRSVLLRASPVRGSQRLDPALRFLHQPRRSCSGLLAAWMRVTHTGPGDPCRLRRSRDRDPDGHAHAARLCRRQRPGARVRVDRRAS